MATIETKSSYLIGAALLCALIAAGCDKGRSTREISEPPLRAGSPTVSIQNVYVDDRPSISGDGQKVVFVSGRQSTDATSSLKVFKTDWPSGGTPSAPARLTATEDLGFEHDAVLAPNGNFVLIAASTGSQNDLWLQAYAGGDPIRLTDDAVGATQEIAYAFSPGDAKLVAWISRDLDAGVSELKIVELAEDGKPGSPVVVKTTAPFVSDFLWLPTASGYAMAVGSSPRGAGKLEYERLTFTDLAGAAEPSSTTLVEDVAPAPNVRPAASNERLLLARRVIPVGSRQALRSGDAESDKQQLGSAKSEPWSIDFTVAQDAIKTDSFSDLPGTDVLALAMTADGSTAFVLERNAWRCASDSADRYGAAIVQASPDLSSYGRIVPRAGATEGSWEVATEYCDRTRSDGSTAVIDDRITSFRVNADATNVKYRMVYVSRFSAARDESCNYVLGDPEVLVLDVDGSTRKIYPVSSNPAPLESKPRPEGKEACGI